MSMPSRAANPPATSSATAPKEEEKEEPAKPAPVANVAAPAPAPAPEKTFFGIGYDQCMSSADTTVDNLAILVKRAFSLSSPVVDSTEHKQ